MRRQSFTTPDHQKTARERVESLGVVKAAASFGISPATLNRVLAGASVQEATLSRIAPKVRTAEEFTATHGTKLLRPVQRTTGGTSWTLERIRAARDAQLAGQFYLPVELARSTRTDDALFAARRNRIAPQTSIATQLRPVDSERGARACARATASIFAPKSVLRSIHGTMADHGVAIGYVDHEVNEDGTRVDMRLSEWPLEHVRWNASREILETQTRLEGLQDIVHGDGRWIIFRKDSALPWTHEACILPASMIWAAHAGGLADWAAASTSHGQAKIIGELPAGVSLQGADGLSPDAHAFLDMLQDVVSGAMGAALRPAGSKTEFLANGSSAWQVFSELIKDRTGAAWRVYCGTDAGLGSKGGAPGVDIAALFGIESTILQSDLGAIEDGLNSGLVVPWTAINEGSSQYAPRWEYLTPDPDAAAKSAEKASARERLTTTLKAMREQHLIVDQALVDQLAKEFGVSPAPKLAPTPVAAAPAAPAPVE